jgi:cytochrome o ubiquinol oxidase subunit 2
MTLLPPALSVRRLASLAAVLLLGGCGEGVLNPQGPIGAQERTILINALAIMLAIVVPTILAGFVFAWWFRAGNPRAKRMPEWEFSGRIELIVWSIPILVIFFLGGLIWVGSHRLDPYRPIEARVAPIEVQVVALDWKWLFLYPGQNIASLNQLVVPVGVPVHFTLTSGSVMNSFFVPQLGGQIAVMNGMVTQLSLQADRPGIYRGQSAQFSGDGFSGMNFTMRAVPQPEYDAWIAGARAAGPVLNLPAYRALARQSENVPPATWRAIQPGLFDGIARQHVLSAPGPAAQ